MEWNDKRAAGGGINLQLVSTVPTAMHKLFLVVRDGSMKNSNTRHIHDARIRNHFYT